MSLWTRSYMRYREWLKIQTMRTCYRLDVANQMLAQYLTRSQCSDQEREILPIWTFSISAENRERKHSQKSRF